LCFKLLLLIVFTLPIFDGVAQNSKPFEHKNRWLDLGLGFNYANSNLTRFDNDIPFTGEDLSGIGILINPKYQVFVLDKYSIGLNIGFGFESFKNNDINYKILRYDYSVGLQTEYFFNVFKNLIFISGELISSFHYIIEDISLENAELNGFDNTYFKSGLNINISTQISKKLNFYVKFSDWITYLSTDENFYEFENGLNINNGIDNFINFPQFGLRYRLF